MALASMVLLEMLITPVTILASLNWLFSAAIATLTIKMTILKINFQNVVFFTVFSLIIVISMLFGRQIFYQQAFALPLLLSIFFHSLTMIFFGMQFELTHEVSLNILSASIVILVIIILLGMAAVSTIFWMFLKENPRFVIMVLLALETLITTILYFLVHASIVEFFKTKLLPIVEKRKHDFRMLPS